MCILLGYILLFYNVALASAILQSESFVCLYIYIYIYIHTHTYISPLCDNFMFYTLSPKQMALWSNSHFWCFLKIFFWCGLFKSLLNLLQCCFCFIALVFWPRGMWDLSFLTRDWTCTPCSGRWSLNHWTIREVLSLVIILSYFVQ